jgi:predicted ATPase/DNA-binding CsgD family transcriptional regulator
MTLPGAGEDGSAPDPPQSPRRLRAVEPAEAEPAPHTAKRPLHNLPLELSSFVGREREMSEVKELLADHRLLTLTGPGGCGKTRLALAVARNMVGGFEDGAWMVELASLADPALVTQTVASTLGVSEQLDRPLAEALVDHLEPKKLLLILDNCEHLVEACARLADILLRSCPQLRILATSREPLGMAGETAWRVPSLSLPDPDQPPSAQQLTQYEAIRLFVDRAMSALLSFNLTDRNAPSVAQICWRLDGIPLAIELAAARVAVLSPRQIAARLDDRLHLLTAGNRTALPRQQTLRGTLDWSYELLSEPERTLLNRLSVFAGGWTLEAAEEVCAGDGIEGYEVADLLARLVAKSLVAAEEREGERRYRMLETVRQYAREKLLESGEADHVRSCHLAYFLSLAERAEPELEGQHQGAWFDVLEEERDNLQAALEWSRTNEADAEEGLRLGSALWRFWQLRGHGRAGREQLEKLLTLAGSEVPAAVRVKAQNRLGYLALLQGDDGAAQSYVEDSLAEARELGDEEQIVQALANLGELAEWRADYPRARSLLEESLALARELGDRPWWLCWVLARLADVARAEGDWERAVALCEDSRALARELQDRHGIARSLLGLARIAGTQGDHERALRLQKEALSLFRDLRDRTCMARCFEDLAWLASEQGRGERAARLFGAAEALREATGTVLVPYQRTEHDRRVAAVRASLDEAAFRTAWATGRPMPLEQAIEYALEDQRVAPSTSSGAAGGLSPREIEVLRLVAEGLTDGQVAERLYLSPRTVGNHLRSIYKKLGVPSRAAAAREAVEQGLI